MDFLLRCVMLALAASTMGYVVGALAAAMRLRRGVGDAAPATVADTLLHVRLLPLWGALGTLAFAAIGLARFESRDEEEAIGWLLRGAAMIGAGLLGATVAHLGVQQWRTARLWRTWRSGADRIALPGVTVPAYRIEAGFPIVAVIGIWRPRLVIDAAVVDHCAPQELHAIIAHECGHLRRRDNLRRMLFAATPAPWMPEALHLRWREATEEAADDLAASQTDVRLHLASALVRVARLAHDQHTPAQWPAYLPASALYRGEGLERRVRRLLDQPEGTPTPHARWGYAAAAALAGAALAVQHRLHDVMEVIVAALP